MLLRAKAEGETTLVVSPFLFIYEKRRAKTLLRFSPSFLILFGGVVIEVSLNEYDGCTLVTRARGQVAERAD